jgi:hypothetical protein
VREVNRINEKELELAVEGGASWHDDYKGESQIQRRRAKVNSLDADIVITLLTIIYKTRLTSLWEISIND